MSEGSFETSIYLDNEGVPHNIRVQPETLELEIDGTVNAAGAGPVTSDLRAMVSRGRNSVGLNARLVRLEVEVPGTSDIEVGSILTLPWLNNATFGAVTKPAGQPFTYRDGITGRVSGNSPEKFRG